MTALDQSLLDIIQDAFPLEERPYQVLAEQLGSDEQSVFEAVESLRNSGVIRRIGGVYDSKKLGFISRLCAGKVSDIDKFAAAVDEIPAITHNYVRSHEYNVWFTVIAQSESEIRAIVDGLCASTDLHDVHILTATKKFKINTVMGKVLDERRVILSDPCKGESKDPGPRSTQTCVLSLSDRTRISIACTDLPHTLTPFKDWGVSTEELREDLCKRECAASGQSSGIRRRALPTMRWYVLILTPKPATSLHKSQTFRIATCVQRSMDSRIRSMR